LKEKTEVTRVELMYDDEGASSHVARGNELESIAATDLTPNVSKYILYCYIIYGRVCF
jgi:hypothetical protein